MKRTAHCTTSTCILRHQKKENMTHPHRYLALSSSPCKELCPYFLFTPRRLSSVVCSVLYCFERGRQKLVRKSKLFRHYIHVFFFVCSIFKTKYIYDFVFKRLMTVYWYLIWFPRLFFFSLLFSFSRYAKFCLDINFLPVISRFVYGLDMTA